MAKKKSKKKTKKAKKAPEPMPGAPEGFDMSKLPKEAQQKLKTIKTKLDKFKSKLLVSAALKELLQNHFIKGYPVLREVSRGLIAQAEHTVMVTTEGCEVLTK